MDIGCWTLAIGQPGSTPERARRDGDQKLKNSITDIVYSAVKMAASEGVVPQDELPIPIIEITRDRKFGDYATNIAMVLASRVKENPRVIAEKLAEWIKKTDGGGMIHDIQIAGPGFINLTMTEEFWAGTLKSVLTEGETYADNNIGRGRKVQVEFVSANPTGPLHVGHGRGAALGDALANVLAASGYDVSREYYVNDAGNQIDTLGRSVRARYLELFGKEDQFPEEGYRGEYIRDIAMTLKEKRGDVYLDGNPESDTKEIAEYSAGVIMDDIKDDLEQFGILFNHWFYESSLFDNGDVDLTLKDLEGRNHLYREEGALWFKSTPLGDDKDRVVIKADGSATYFASDLAYHRNKFSRGFDKVINIWGADHHGYIERMKAGVVALGRDRDDLEVILVQLVNLLRGGKPVAMSTRAGEFVTLREVLEEVGKDAARFIFLTRKADSKLDFDLDVAKARSNDNPVYYVQYAHARICSILRNAEENGFKLPSPEDVNIGALKLPEEKELIRHMAALPDVIEGAAMALEPHRLTNYLRDISTSLHNYYFHHRVLSDDPSLTEARLALMVTVRTAIAKGLGLLGVSTPERM
ncbi:MAG: arginine--tRNA ligase [bacterium]